MKKKIRITGIICPKCKAFIFSRARHDFHSCPCGEVFIDGGFDYVRMGFKDVMPEYKLRYLPVTRQELFDDWNKHIDKYGVEPCQTKQI